MANAQKLIDIREACHNSNDIVEWIQRARLEYKQLEVYGEEGKRRRLQALSSGDDAQVRHVDALCDQLAQISRRLQDSIALEMRSTTIAISTSPVEMPKENEIAPVMQRVAINNSTQYKLFDIPQILKSLLKVFLVASLLAAVFRAPLHLNDYQSGAFIFSCLFYSLLWRVWKWSGFKTRSVAKRIFVVIGSLLILSSSIGVISTLGMMIFGVAYLSSQPAVTPIVTYRAPVVLPTIDRSETLYLDGVASVVKQFDADHSAALKLMNNPIENIFDVQYNKWHDQVPLALTKASDDLNAVYSLNPTPRFRIAHEHLLNVAYDFQQFSQEYLNWFYTGSIRNLAKAQYADNANTFYRLFLRERNLFETDIINAANSR